MMLARLVLASCLLAVAAAEEYEDCSKCKMQDIVIDGEEIESIKDVQDSETCCYRCDGNDDCEFWVHFGGTTQTTKICSLRRNKGIVTQVKQQGITTGQQNCKTGLTADGSDAKHEVRFGVLLSKKFKRKVDKKVQKKLNKVKTSQKDLLLEEETLKTAPKNNGEVADKIISRSLKVLNALEPGFELKWIHKDTLTYVPGQDLPSNLRKLDEAHKRPHRLDLFVLFLWRGEQRPILEDGTVCSSELLQRTVVVEFEGADWPNFEKEVEDLTDGIAKKLGLETSYFDYDLSFRKDKSCQDCTGYFYDRKEPLSGCSKEEWKRYVHRYEESNGGEFCLKKVEEVRPLKEKDGGKGGASKEHFCKVLFGC